MHKSKLAGFIIDCERGDLDAGTAFWSGALGYKPLASNEPHESNYRLLDASAAGLQVELQRVDHPSRVHLDIEADDIEAEVLRLEALGAKRIQQVKTWWVMEAPTGHRFCVIQPQRADFADTANRWGE